MHDGLRQGPAGPAPIAPLPWLTETSEFFPLPAPPAVRFEIAEVSYPAADPRPSRPFRTVARRI